MMTQGNPATALPPLDLVEIARSLNQGGVSAAPCAWLSALSIFDAEDYENYDLDMIGPRTRLKIIKILEAQGFRQTSGNVLEGAGGRLEFPRPTRSLSSDPAQELEHVLARRPVVVFATPTQIVMATFRAEGQELSAKRRADLIDLVREHPANLDKISGWLSRSSHAAAYRELVPQLVRAQEKGSELRRRGEFRSGLPR